MKKWYQPCGWILVAALALQLSGCAKGSAYLAKITGRQADDQKLVEVDGKEKKKGSSKKSDSLRDKAGESQLAKKSSKPKVESSDDSKLASTKKSSKSSRDPFLTEDSEEVGAKSRRKADSDSSDVLAKADDTKKPTKSAVGVAEQGPRIQEVAHKVEDNLADLPDLPEWARDGATATAAPKSKAADPGFAAFCDTETSEPAQKKVAARSAPKMDEQPSVDLASLCPDARGELRDLVRGLKESDTEGLKRGVHRIGRMGPEAQAAAPALIHLLKHKDGFVRTHSALALARMQASPPEAVQTVVDGLKSTDPGLRSFAAAVLAEMGPQADQALTILAESLNDRDGYVRLHAAEVLIRKPQWSYQALDTLLGGLTHKDENLRWLATYSLAELAPESQETIDALLKATHDPVVKVQVGAVYALGEIGPFARSAASELRKLADSSSNQELHSAILYALQQIEQ